MENFYFSVILITLYITHSIIPIIKRKDYNLNNYYYSSVQTYVLNTSGSLYKTNKLFLSFSIDSHQIRQGLSKPSLRNSELIRLTSYLSPGYLRIGGTDADCLVFKEENSVSRSRLNLNSQDTFNMSDKMWTEIYKFAELTGFKVLFDLNVLLRNGSRWDSSNAKSLIDFSATKGYKVDWQLGNEPNAFRHKFDETVSPYQLAEDFITLRHLLNSYPEYREALVVGPDVTSPHCSVQEVTVPAESFLHKFMNSGNISHPVDAVAWHHYYLHRNATVSDFLSPGVFDSLKKVIDLVKEAVKRSWRLLWITESGAACGGGVTGLSDRFVSSFLLLDSLGLAAREGVALVVRQSLFAGHYALIDRTTLQPNPDWWVSYVYKRLVAPTVLSIEVKGAVQETLRLYAHCSHNGSVVVFGVNLSDAPEQLLVETSNTSAAAAAQLFQLTAPDLLSQKVILNGVPLRLPSDSPPALQSVTVDIFQPIELAGHSIFFLHLDYLQPYPCQIENT